MPDLDAIIKRYPAMYKRFKETGELVSPFYDELYEYYLSTGEMPYGIAKARTGDPDVWIADRLEGYELPV